MMGKYHPHGDLAIYDALVRMAQDFSMRAAADRRAGQLRLGRRRSAGGHALHRSAAGEVGDGAARRHRQGHRRLPAELRRHASIEPTVLPARFPNLLVNGAGGIAVGMATNIPPHNLGEVIDACLALIDNPEITIDELMEIVPGPDFPTGGVDPRPRRHARRLPQGPRLGHHARQSRRSRRSASDREAIIVTEIPYQVNKATLIERIAELVREKRIEGIADVRDETDRDGMRIVIELQARRDARRGAQPALPLHAAADDVRRQHAGAERRPAGSAELKDMSDRLHRLPRGGGHPPHQVPAATRRASGPTCWSGSRSPSPTSTR